MADTHELEITREKYIYFNLAQLKEAFPTEWREALESYDYDEEEAERDFAINVYEGSPLHELFTVRSDDYSVYLYALKPRIVH